MLLRIVTVLLLAATALGCKPPPNSGAANSAPASAIAATGSAVGPGNVIPVGRIAADVMEYGTPWRVTELVKRRGEAIRQNPQWWNEHMKNVKPGERVPYDARMGLTPEEYDELQTLSKKTSTRKKADATITITSKGNDVYLLDGGPSLPDLTGIEIDLKNDSVRTPFGVTGKQGAYKISESSPTGAHTGVRWKFATPDAGDEAGATVALSFGRLEPSSRGILIYYVKKLTPPEEKKRLNIMLYYDLPAGP